MKAWPARSARAIRSMASGNCSSNMRRRFVALAPDDQVRACSAEPRPAATPPTNSRSASSRPRSRPRQRRQLTARNAPDRHRQSGLESQLLEPAGHAGVTGQQGLEGGTRAEPRVGRRDAGRRAAPPAGRGARGGWSPPRELLASRAGRRAPSRGRESTPRQSDEGGERETHRPPQLDHQAVFEQLGRQREAGLAPVAARTSDGCRWRGTRPSTRPSAERPRALEQEDVLHRDHALLHAGDLADGGDAAASVRQPRQLHDDVDAPRPPAGGPPFPGCSGWPSRPSCRGGRARRAGCWRGWSSGCRRGRCSSPAACRALRRRAPRRRRCDRGACAGR